MANGVLRIRLAVGECRGVAAFCTYFYVQIKYLNYVNEVSVMACPFASFKHICHYVKILAYDTNFL